MRCLVVVKALELALIVGAEDVHAVGLLAVKLAQPTLVVYARAFVGSHQLLKQLIGLSNC